ncbi:hypothetical protein I547_7646 [Mycobacterium kansasii 824]|nr:hypothetical protein I547_7646 [Mycobacterium kansasii 824]
MHPATPATPPRRRRRRRAHLGRDLPSQPAKSNGGTTNGINSAAAAPAPRHSPPSPPHPEPTIST